MRCLNESLGAGRLGVDGAFPEESLQSVSLRDICQSTLSALKHSNGLDFRQRLTQSPMVSV